MRLQGRIVEWNDERGFGFVVADGGSDRHFFHISELRGTTGQRPAAGQAVSFAATRQADGKRRAVDLRYVDAPRREQTRPRTGSARPLGWAPDMALAVGQLALPAWLVAQGRLPTVLLAVIAVMSSIAFVMYNADKRRAERGDWRIPEAKLQLAGLLGGWLGALAAQPLFRHKSSKASFVHVFRLAGIVGLIALGWAAHPQAFATLAAFAHAR